MAYATLNEALAALRATPAADQTAAKRPLDQRSTLPQEHTMAFVNEFSSKEDREKYGIAELQRKNQIPGYDAWTIDRERNIILMFTGRGHDLETSNLQQFLLSRNGKTTTHWLMQNFDETTRTILWTLQRAADPVFKSDEDRQHYEARNNDLKDALRAYKAGGIYETPSNDFENVVFSNF